MANNNGTFNISRVCKHFHDRGLNFSIKQTKLSSINRLFGHLFGHDAEVLLVCHVDPQAMKRDKHAIITEEESSLERLDVTGSPLEHSFGDDSFNVTLSPTTRNWLKDEEKYRPLPKKLAPQILTFILEAIDGDNNWNLPIFVLCDQKDTEENSTVLLGSYCEFPWWHPIQVALGNITTLTNIQNECSELLSSHLEARNANGRTENDLVIVTDSIYELCGTSHEMVDWKEKATSKGYLKIEASWPDVSFLPPSTASTRLYAEIVSGSRKSPLCDMWNEILLLNEYLSMIEDYYKKDSSSRYSVKPLIFPKDFITPFFQSETSVTDKLNRLLTGDDSVVDEDTPELLVRDCEYEKLMEIVRELSKRQNRDFTDRLWQITRGTDNYMQMTDCIYAVFEAITDNNYRPQLNDMDETRFSKMVSKLNSDNPKISLRAGSLSLELMVDIGMKKISRDYIYLLSSMNLMEADELRKNLGDVSTGDFNIMNYRNKLLALGKIHIALEFLQLVQSELICRYDISNAIFEAALKKYMGNDSPVKSEDLTKNITHTLRDIPATKELLAEASKRAPSSWMCSISAPNHYEEVTHYSRVPIFPPNIYSPEFSGPDDFYHVTKATRRFVKFA